MLKTGQPRLVYLIRIFGVILLVSVIAVPSLLSLRAGLLATTGFEKDVPVGNDAYLPERGYLYQSQLDPLIVYILFAPMITIASIFSFCFIRGSTSALFSIGGPFHFRWPFRLQIILGLAILFLGLYVQSQQAYDSLGISCSVSSCPTEAFGVAIMLSGIAIAICSVFFEFGLMLVHSKIEQ